MYITVMDYSRKNVTKLVWDVEDATTEEVEILLESIGYKISQIAYLTTADEPDYGGCVEVSDLLPDFHIEKMEA